MASATDTAKAEPNAAQMRRPRPGLFRPGGSRLGTLILLLNLLSLLILLGGALVLNEWRRGLVEARQETLLAQAELMVRVLGSPQVGVTRGEPIPTLDQQEAPQWLKDSFVRAGQRARLYDADGVVLADSYEVTEAIPGSPLPAAHPAGTPQPDSVRRQTLRQAHLEVEANQALAEEVERALDGQPQATVRRSETGEQVVSVSVPVRHVQQVLGVLTLEAGDVDAILAAQRWALMPFALVAFGVSLLSWWLMHMFVAQPVMRLSAAADEVRLQRSRAISLPDLEGRKDEIGDLARSLETMTETLSARMDAIEAFAADVSHEIKNPLTSIRSALETLPLVKSDEQRTRLTNLLQQDVRRLDRLITDISNASRLDAELARDRPRDIELHGLLSDIVSVYEGSRKRGQPPVRLTAIDAPVMVNGRDTALGQVFRNLIDNARSFSPDNRPVQVTLDREPMDSAAPIRIRVEDEGPGIPEENLETVFERFYTSRPKGTAFGNNSGLGLSIVRQIVEAHGGWVRASNRHDAEGRVTGARFEVALPEAPGTASGRRV